MAEIYKLKKGTSSLGWRWLGRPDSSSNMAYYEYLYGGPRMTFSESHRLTYQAGGKTLPNNPADLVSFYNNNEDFRTYLSNNIWHSNIAEGDILFFTTNSGLYYHVYKYVDLSTVFDITYKGSPVYKITKEGNTIFHKEYAGGSPVLIDYTARTYTSITWKVQNSDQKFNTDIYINSQINSTPWPASFYINGIIDGLNLNQNLKRGTNIPTDSYTTWQQTGLSFGTVYYPRAVIDIPGKAIKDGVSGSSYNVSTLTNGIQAEFVSSTTNSITFRIYNYSSTTIRTVQYGPQNYNTTSAAGISPGSWANFTLSGLSSGTNYTIYIKTIHESSVEFTTTLSASTQSAYSVSPPVFTSTDGSYCTPRITLKNNNSFSVSVYAGDTNSPTYKVGTLAANAAGTFSVPPAKAAGTLIRIWARFHSSGTYSSVTNENFAISLMCMEA